MTLLISLLFIALGILIKNGKKYSLVAGYNTMTDEEKSKYDIVKAATLFRNVMFYMALINMAGFIYWLNSGNYNYEVLFVMGSVLTGVPYLLIKANSDKYKIKD